MTELIKYGIGIDISKDKLDACFCEMDNTQFVKIKSTHRFSNDLNGFKELEQWLKKHQKQKLLLNIVIEATGVYYEKIAIFLYKNKIPVSIILPNKAKKYMQALGLKSKNDKIDSSGLGRMAAEQKLIQWEPMDDYFYKLRQLTRHYEQLQESKTHFNNQLHALKNSSFEVKQVLTQQNKMIALIEKQIKETYKIIESHINSNKEVKQKVENICKIKGVGLLTVSTIIAETNGFVLFKNIRQLVSYAGYDVVENQSGSHVGKSKISKKGNSHIRRILHMSSFITVKYNQKPFVDLYNRVYDKTKLIMKGYVAVHKKLLIYIYTLWNKNEAYCPMVNDFPENEEQSHLFLINSEIKEHYSKEIVPIFTGTMQNEFISNILPETIFVLR